MGKLFTSIEMIELTNKSIREMEEVAKKVAYEFLDEDVDNAMSCIHTMALKGKSRVIFDDITFYTSQGEYSPQIEGLIRWNRSKNIAHKLISLGYKAIPDGDGDIHVNWVGSVL